MLHKTLVYKKFQRRSCRFFVKTTQSLRPGRLTLCSFYAPINVFPHHPPLGPKWGFTGGIDTKLLPHYGAFDTSIDSIFDISIDTSIDISIFDILCLPHCGEFDIRVCQIPTIAPYNPEGGVVGEYIDRCITKR